MRGPGLSPMAPGQGHAKIGFIHSENERESSTRTWFSGLEVNQASYTNRGPRSQAKRIGSTFSLGVGSELDKAWKSYEYDCILRRPTRIDITLSWHQLRVPIPRDSLSGSTVLAWRHSLFFGNCWEETSNHQSLYRPACWERMQPQVRGCYC